MATRSSQEIHGGLISRSDSFRCFSLCAESEEQMQAIARFIRPKSLQESLDFDMPLVRYEIRSEYELANRELYRSAPKNDPEAILEGVAMVSLVGIVRQLGDLAEFAADIFHDLHEAVMATASRSHDLVLRVAQLEAELSSVEKNFFSKKTNPLQFAYSPGVEFHANIQIDQNHCTQGDLPRFIRSSYEECRGPPKLFLLDKFDIGGVGACLKRYTDPSFFKMEWASAELMKAEKAQQDKKARKAKKARRRKDTESKDARPTIHLQPRMRYSTISTSSVDALSESTTPLGTMMVDNDETNKPYPFTTFLGGSQHGSRDGKSPLKSVRKSELDKDVAHVKTAPPEIEEVTEMGPQEDAAKENEIMMIQSNEVHEDVLSEPEQFMDARATIDSESDSEPRWRRRWADTKLAIPTASRSDKELKVQEPEDDTDAFFEDARNSNMDSETEAESKYSVDLTPIPIPVQHGDIQHDSIELARHDGYDEQASSVPEELKHEDSTDMKDKEIAGELRNEHVVSHEDMNGQASKDLQPEDDVRVDRTTDRQSNDFEQNIQHTTIGEGILEKEVNNELHEHGREGILHPVQRQEKSETKIKANSDVDEDEPFDVEVIQVIGDEPKEVEFEQVAMSEDEPEPLDKEVEQDQVVVEKEPATETLSSVNETESEEVKEPLTTFKVKDSGTLQETQEYDRFTAEELKEPVVQEERQELESEESKELVQESDVHNLVEDELKDSRGSAAFPKTPTSSEAEVEDREVEREDDFESASSQDDFFQSSSRFSDAGYSDAISFANDQMGVADDEDGYSGDDESTKNDHSGEASEPHSPVAGEGQEDPHVSHEHVSHVEPVVLQNVLLQSKEELLDESVRLQPENEEIFEQNVGIQPHKELEVQDEDDKHYKLEDLVADEQNGEQEHELSRSYEDLATQPSCSYEDVSRLEVNKEQQVQQYFEQKVEDKVQGEELKDEGSESHVREHPDGYNIQYTLDEQNQESIPPLVDEEIAEKQVDTESRSIDLQIVPEPSSVPLSIAIPETSDEDLLYSELEKSDSTESSPRSPVFSALQAPMSPVQSPDTTADFTTMLAPNSPTAGSIPMLDELTPTAGAMPMTLDELPPAASSLPTLDELPPLPPLPPLRWRTSHSPRQPFAFRIPGLSSEVPQQSVLSDARPVIADKQVHPEVAATHSVALPEVYVQSSPVSDKQAELESAPEVLPPRMREQQVPPEVAATHSVALPEVSVQSSPVCDKQAELESAPEVLPPRMREQQVHPEVAATHSVALPEVFVQSSPVSDKQAELESAPEVLPPRMREQSHPESAPVPEVSEVVPRIDEQEPQQHPESVLEASEAPVDKQAHLEPVLQAPEPVTEVLEAPESHPEPVTDVFEAPEAHPEPIPEVSKVLHEPEPVQHPEAVLEVLEAPGDKQVHPEPVTEVPEAHTELVTQMPEVAESHPEPVTEMPEVLEAHSEPAPEDESEPTTEISAHPDDKQAHAPATEAASGSLEPGNTQPEESLPPLSDKQVQAHAEPAHSQVQAHPEPAPSPSENSSSLTQRLRSLFFGDKEVHSEPAAGVSEKPLESLQVGDRPKAADQGALEGSARSSHEPSQPVDDDHAHPEPAVSESLRVDEGPETVVSHPEVPLQRVSVSDKPEASSSESSLTGRLKSYLFGDKKANSDSASRGGDDLQATVHQPESVQPGDVKVSEGSTLSLETPEMLQAQSEVVEQRSPEPAVHQAELSEEESPSKQTLEVLQPELEVVEQSSPPEDVVLEQSTQAEDGIETYEKILPVTQAHAEPVLETLHTPSDAEEDIQWPGLAQLTAERSPPADERSVHPEPEGVGELGYHEHHNSALEVLEVSSVPESWLLDDFQSPEPPAQPTSRRRKWTDSEIFEASLRVLEHESGEEAEEDLPVSSAPETYLELEQPTQPQASQGLPVEEDQGVCSTLKDLPVDEFEHPRQPGVLQTPGVHLHKPPETLRDNNEQTSPEIPSPPAENGQRHSGTTPVPFLPTIPLFANKDGSLLQAITEHDKSKMKRVPSDLRPKALDERGDLLEQIRAQSFNLRHTVVEKKQHKEAATPPRLVNNINVAAILEKANAIRQAFAGSDDDQDDDWSD